MIKVLLSFILVSILVSCGGGKSNAPQKNDPEKLAPIEKASFDVAKLNGYWKVESIYLDDIFPKFGFSQNAHNMKVLAPADEQGQIEIESPFAFYERQLTLLSIDARNFKKITADTSSPDPLEDSFEYVVSSNLLLTKNEQKKVMSVKFVTDQTLETEDGARYIKISEQEFSDLQWKQKRLFATSSSSENNFISAKVDDGYLKGEMYEAKSFYVRCGPHKKDGIAIKGLMLKVVSENPRIVENFSIFLRVNNVGMQEIDQGYTQKTFIEKLSATNQSPFVFNYTRGKPFSDFQALSKYQLDNSSGSACKITLEKSDKNVFSGEFSCAGLYNKNAVFGVGLNEQLDTKVEGKFVCNMEDSLVD